MCDFDGPLSASLIWIHQQALQKALVHPSTYAHGHLPSISPFWLTAAAERGTHSVDFLEDGSLLGKKVPNLSLSLTLVANTRM